MYTYGIIHAMRKVQLFIFIDTVKWKQIEISRKCVYRFCVSTQIILVDNQEVSVTFDNMQKPRCYTKQHD